MNQRDNVGSSNDSRVEGATRIAAGRKRGKHGQRGGRALTVFFALATLASREAHAQEWTKDRRFGDGKGYRTGDFELHPGLGAEFGYDSNYFLRTDNAGNSNSGVVGGEVLRITPSLTFNTAGPAPGQPAPDGTAPVSPSIALRGGLSGTYYQFFGPKELVDQSNVGGNANLRLDILPGRPVGATIFAGYSRVLKPSTDGIADNSFNRDIVTGGVEGILMPGGGTFDIRLGYKFTGEFFEQSNGVPFTNFQHEITVRDRWRFRPRTALFHDTSLGFVTYPNKARSANLLEDSTPLTTRLGITGLLTPRFSVLAAVGYGTTLLLDAASATTQQYDSPIGQAEATFYLTSTPNDLEPGAVSLSTSTLTFGYTRDFQKSFIGGGYYGSDRGYAVLSYFFGNKALVSLNGNVGAVEYNDIYENNAVGAPTKIHSGFTDVRLGSTLFGEYHFLDSLGVNLTLDYSQNLSNTVLNFGTGGAGAGNVGTPSATTYDMSWKRFQGFVGVRYFL